MSLVNFRCCNREAYIEMHPRCIIACKAHIPPPWHVPRSPGNLSRESRATS